MLVRRAARSSTSTPSTCATVVVPMDWRHPDATATSRSRSPSSRRPAPPRACSPATPAGPGAGRPANFTDGLALSKPRCSASTTCSASTRAASGEQRRHRRVRSTTQAKLDTLPKVADRRVRNRADPRDGGRRGQAVRSRPAPATEFGPLPQHPADRLGRGLPPRAARSEQRTDRNYAMLNYIGYSYGTWLGAWYADTYPSQVGRFILDSNMQLDDAACTSTRRLDSKLLPAAPGQDVLPVPGPAQRRLRSRQEHAKSVKKKYESTRKKLATQAKKALKKGRTPVIGSGGPGLRSWPA